MLLSIDRLNECFHKRINESEKHHKNSSPISDSIFLGHVIKHSYKCLRLFA